MPFNGFCHIAVPSTCDVHTHLTQRCSNESSFSYAWSTSLDFLVRAFGPCGISVLPHIWAARPLDSPVLVAAAGADSTLRRVAAPAVVTLRTLMALLASGFAGGPTVCWLKAVIKLVASCRVLSVLPLIGHDPVTSSFVTRQKLSLLDSTERVLSSSVLLLTVLSGTWLSLYFDLSCCCRHSLSSGFSPLQCHSLAGHRSSTLASVRCGAVLQVRRCFVPLPLQCLLRPQVGPPLAISGMSLPSLIETSRFWNHCIQQSVLSNNCLMSLLMSGHTCNPLRWWEIWQLLHLNQEKMALSGRWSLFSAASAIYHGCG